MISACRRSRGLAWLTLAVALVGCGRLGGGEPGARRGALQISFEDEPEPGVFAIEGPAVRDGPKGAEGLWAAVAGLPRPERALVLNPGNRRKVVVALFAAPKTATTRIRLSNEAADALAIGDTPADVKITALRRQPKIDTTRGGF